MDWLLLFLWMLLSSGVVGFFAVTNCCCAFCPNDACSTDPGARTVTVTISGVANNLCADCAGMNGTWVFNLSPAPSCAGALVTFFFPCAGVVALPGWTLFVSFNKLLTKSVVYGGILMAPVGLNPQEVWKYEIGDAPQPCPPAGVLPMTLVLLSSQTLCDLSGVVMTVEFT